MLNTRELILALLSIDCQTPYVGVVAALRACRRKIPMKFRPLHDRVVIRRAEGDLKSKGGIIIPDTAKEKPQEGEVSPSAPVPGAKAAS